MPRRKEPAMLSDLLNQLLAGDAASDTFWQDALLESPTKAPVIPAAAMAARR